MRSGSSSDIRRALRLGACLALFGWAAAGLGAHPAGLTSALATIERDGRFQVTVRFDALAFALNDTPSRVPDEAMSALLDGPRADLARRLTEADRRFRRHFHVRADGREIPIKRLQFPKVNDILGGKAESLAPRLPVMASVVVNGQLPAGTKHVDFAFPEIIDTLVFTVERPGQESWTEPLGPGVRSRELTVALSATRDPEPGSGFLATIGRFGALGFLHILPHGLDHVLFVAGLFLLGTRLAPLLWQVTAFTLAHSVTLALSLYGVVRLPSGVIEPLISLSIVLVALDNLRNAELRWWRLPLVFFFGLIHGMGFAGILQDLSLPRGRFLEALVGFNLGVELGQLAVLGLAFLAVGWFRHHASYRRFVVVPASCAVGLVAVGWTASRLISSGG